MKKFIDRGNIVLYCPYCNASTGNFISKLGNEYENDILIEFFFARCSVCSKIKVYLQKSKQIKDGESQNGKIGYVHNKVLDQKILYPIQVVNPKIPMAYKFMPTDVKQLYNEASSVFDLSPRSSGALVRITLERLIKRHVLTDKTGRLNDMIGKLSPTYPDYILKLMDNIRAVGNSKAHDDLRKIRDKEDKKKIIKLFEFINLICRLININEQSDKMFEDLPDNIRQGIEQRNKHYKNKN